MNGWLQTVSGREFSFPRFLPEQIVIEDIAHALAHQCRFAGHTLRFYSVAEHCCLLSDRADDEYKFTALMHDASEAYMLDFPKPLKNLFRSYVLMEESLMSTIAAKFGFEYPLPPQVKNLDLAILSDERQQAMKSTHHHEMEWGNVLPSLGIELQFWSPDVARREFLNRFYLLSKS